MGESGRRAHERRGSGAGSSRRLLGPSDSRAEARASRRASREFVYLKRQLPPMLRREVVQLGSARHRSEARVSPLLSRQGRSPRICSALPTSTTAGRRASSSPIEDWLAGKPGSRRVIKDRLGRVVEDAESVRPPSRRARSGAFHRPQAAISGLPRAEGCGAREHRAKAGGIVVLDVRSGEVLGARQRAGYNPNNRDRRDARARATAPITDLFEPGSTLKPFTVAAALEARVIGPRKPRADRAGLSARWAATTIHDVHPAGRAHRGAGDPALVQRRVSAKMALSAAEASSSGACCPAVGFGIPPRTRLPRRGRRAAARLSELAAHRAGDAVVRPWHLGEPAAARARLYRVLHATACCSRSLLLRRDARRRRARDLARHGAGRARHAGNGRAAGRHRRRTRR